MAVPGDIALLLGRVLFGGYFAFAGLAHFRNAKMMAGYASTKGVPFPTLAILGTGGLLLFGGLSVITGVFPLVGLAAITLFLVGVTPMMHDFWTFQDPAQRTAEQNNFIRNVVFLGATLALMALPRPWSLSLLDVV